MLELVKLVWDVFVLRDAARRGQLNWRVWVVAIAFVLILYGTGLPAAMLYDKHPQYKGFSSQPSSWTDWSLSGSSSGACDATCG